MQRARTQELGSGLTVIGFLLMLTAIGMASWRWSAAIDLWFFGALIFWCCVCGARQMPLRQIPGTAWAGMALGLLLIAQGVLWTFIHKTPRAVPLTLGMLITALATTAIGWWVYQRGSED